MSGKLFDYLGELSKLFREMTISDRHGAELQVDQGVDNALDLIRSVRGKGANVLVVGNGGSAAIASHLQNDLCKAVGLRSLVFTEQPLLTALSNDDGYEVAYESLVRLWANEGDLLIAISSSGRSNNILNAVSAARARRLNVLTLSGFDGDNPLRKSGDVNLYIPSHSYGLVEIAHAALTQFFTDVLQKERV
jgi:D-sedoheptulose 7-phosphate isomerase